MEAQTPRIIDGCTSQWVKDDEKAVLPDCRAARADTRSAMCMAIMVVSSSSVSTYLRHPDHVSALILHIVHNQDICFLQRGQSQGSGPGASGGRSVSTHPMLGLTRDVPLDAAMHPSPCVPSKG